MSTSRTETQRAQSKGIVRLGLGALCALAMMLATASAASASSIVFAGIDAEDGGPGAHGPIANYCQLVGSMIADVDGAKASASGILVIGNDGTDDAGAFWAAIDSCSAESVTFVDTATNISSQSFAAFKMLAVVGSENETFGNALDQDEQDALVGRNSDVTSHVNSGGALLGFTQTGLTNQYQYVGGVGALSGDDGLSYDDVTPTPAGTARGITNDLDVCCWHNDFSSVPSGFDVLAFRESSGDAAAIGTGSSVSTEDCTNGVDDDGDDLVDDDDPDCQTTQPENCTNGVDDDGDNLVDGDDPDCQNGGGGGGGGAPTCFGMPATGGPTPGDDVIIGTFGPDTINALTGDDDVCSRGGDDDVQGDGDDDRIRAGNGDDEAAGGGSNDLVEGGQGLDTVRGAGGEDQLFGQRDDDRLNGGKGDDELRGGAGDDNLNGGPGFDLCQGNSGNDTSRNCEINRGIENVLP